LDFHLEVLRQAHAAGLTDVHVSGQWMAQAVATLTLNGRGAWRAVCTDGSVLELGRGSEDELMARVERLVRTYGAATARWRAPLELADLRYEGGYALRLKGVTTGAAASAPRSN
jgi:cell division protein FtsQ